jgi:hypothetical protein
MQSKKDSEAARQARVRQLCQARAPEEHTATGVLIFYGWLAHYYPELLKRGKGDPYQYLKVDLNGLIRGS